MEHTARRHGQREHRRCRARSRDARIADAVVEPLIHRPDDGGIADQVGPEGVVDARERVDVGDHVEWTARLHLRDDDHLPSVFQPVAVQRQLVRAVDAEPMPHVEVRRPFAAGNVVAVLADDAGVERVGIGRFRQRV